MALPKLLYSMTVDAILDKLDMIFIAPIPPLMLIAQGNSLFATMTEVSIN